jgi:hypothetical protein
MGVPYRRLEVDTINGPGASLARGIISVGVFRQPTGPAQALPGVVL